MDELDLIDELVKAAGKGDWNRYEEVSKLLDKILDKEIEDAQ